MRTTGLLIGELWRTGATRKAIRLYETRGLLPAPRRTPAGYRVYDPEAVELLEFIAQARHLGFTFTEAATIVQMRRAGQRPCEHVRPRGVQSPRPRLHERCGSAAVPVGHDDARSDRRAEHPLLSDRHASTRSSSTLAWVRS